MDANEAIGILRGDVSPASVLHRGIAEKMGAQALEAWEWVARMGCAPEGCGKDWQVYAGNGYGEGPTPLAAVLDAMEKEGKA